MQKKARMGPDVYMRSGIMSAMMAKEKMLSCIPFNNPPMS